jgi:hypothetical protein
LIRNIKKPSCHPELSYYAKGMCRNCYEKNLRKINPDFAQRQRENTKNWVKIHKKWKVESDAKYRQEPFYKERRSIRTRKNKFSEFGLSLNDGDVLLEIQHHRCGICGSMAQKERNKHYLEFDHDHKTNEPRGFLCQKCNKGLGLLGDNLEGIERAIQYLKNPPFKTLKIKRKEE